MAHEAKSYDHLIGRVKGLSERQLRAHFTLYQGYVKKLNEIEERLETSDRGTANYSFGEYSELRRREPVAYNGTFLHELFFDALGEGGTAAPMEFKRAASQAFGSYEAWMADVKAGILSAHGWVLTTWSPREGRLRNNLIQSEHHVGLLMDQQVLLAFDGWEHAYFLDYGTAKADYVDAILRAIDWKVVQQRMARRVLGARAAATRGPEAVVPVRGPARGTARGRVRRAVTRGTRR